MVKSSDAGIPTRDNMDVHRWGLASRSQYLKARGQKPRPSVVYTHLIGWHVGMGWAATPPEDWGGPAGMFCCLSPLLPHGWHLAVGRGHTCAGTHSYTV